MTSVESGVDQLIERVKSQAIDKAQKERDEILSNAHKEAQALLDAAKAKVDHLLRENERRLSEERTRLESELSLAARDFSIKIAERLKAQMFFPIIKENVRATLKEPEFLQKVLQNLVDECVKNESVNLDILVPKELKTTLAAFFAGSVFDHLDKKPNITLKDEEGLEGFALIRRGEHYVWDFRSETIAQELMRLVEPRLRKYFTAQKSPQVTTSERATA